MLINADKTAWQIHWLWDQIQYTLVRALILSRLDYCTSLYAGCLTVTLRRLQRVQNAAARLLCGDSPHTHAHPLLKQLHWLPVVRRIQYKLCCLMFDIYHGTAPAYMSELCKPYTDSRLRSAAHSNFVVPRTQLRLAERSSAVSRPKAWNAVPLSIHNITSKDTFARQLKTHFLNQNFNLL